MNRDEAETRVRDAVSSVLDEDRTRVAPDLSTLVREAVSSVLDDLLPVLQSDRVVSSALLEVAQELVRHTEDTNPTDVMRRALGIYRVIVHHVLEGGFVTFTKDGAVKQLKIRVRRTP